MLTHLPRFQQLIRQLQRVPYLASKNVYKVATYFLTADQAAIDQLSTVIAQARTSLKPCKSCYNWAEGKDLCYICASDKRDHSMICVVETWHDLFAIENVGEYHGVYHVLGGSLCPLEGVGPDQLSINALLDRLNDSITEIILATNPTPEGEATASYIWSKVGKRPINISRLASGVPIGASLEYMDRVTIGKALIGRRPF